MSSIQFTNNNSGVFWHDKLFVLNWNLDAKWVLVHFRNGQKKRWWKRTERPYRFKRWFVKSAVDSFSNLANYQSPFVTLYVFHSYFPWPQKIRIPMQVHRFQTKYMPVQTELSPMQHNLRRANVNGPRLDLKSPFFQGIDISMNLKVQFPQVHLPKIEIINLNSDTNEYN